MAPGGGGGGGGDGGGEQHFEQRGCNILNSKQRAGGEGGGATF
jgi:hypothetical protein